MSKHSHQTRPDVRPDPAHRAGDPDDWASEGGAVTEGPATHPADTDETEEPGTETEQEEARRSTDGTED